MVYEVRRRAPGFTRVGSAAASDVYKGDRQYVSQGIQTRARFEHRRGGMRHLLEAGVRLHHDSVDRQHTEHFFAMTSGSLVDLDESSVATDNFDTAFATSLYGVYGLTFWKFTVTPGVRAELVRTSREDDLTTLSTNSFDATVLPGVGLTYAVRRDLDLVAGVHRGYSPVGPGQEDRADPETSIAYELGARYQRPRRGRLLEVMGFVNDYSNLLGQCAFSTGCDAMRLDEQYNGGQVVVFGVEAVGTLRIDFGDVEVPLRATYTYTDSRFRDAFEVADPTLAEVVRGDRLPYIPMHPAQRPPGVAQHRAGVTLSAPYHA